MARQFGITALLALSLSGCAATLGDDDVGTTDPTNQSFALVSSTGEEGVLRRGDSLGITVGALSQLDPNTRYRFEVTAPGGALLSEGDVVTDTIGQLFLATVMHDVGEDGRIAPGAVLGVALRDVAGVIRAGTSIDVDGVPALQVPGWNVQEPQPPHIFAANAAGEPANAYAVGGADPGEQVGPIYVAGDGFPDRVAGRDVDVYVVRDRDEWRGTNIPLAGDPAYLAGPIVVHVDEGGRLATTAVFNPDLTQVGIFDILVDVDRDGRFEWTFDSKDGADGIGRVGFTVQYSAAWLRARESSHLLVNIAYDSHERDGGSWANVFRADSPVFLYLNPPVMERYHFTVTKWIVAHQDFDGFWNNPAMAEADGAVHFAQFAVNSMQGPTQTGCTNTAPVCWGPVPSPPAGQMTARYDVVFDRNGDGRYMPGEDLLDIVSRNGGGDLITSTEYRALPPEQQQGFVVTR